MQPAKRPSCFSANPFFLVQVPLDRFADLIQGLGHPQAGRVERSTLIVVENATHRRAVVEHHGTRRIGLRRGRVRRPDGHRHGGFGIVSGGVPRRLDSLPLEHGLFDLPQATHLLAHLNLGVAVGLQHGLGHVAEEVVLAVAVRHAGKLRRDPRHERVLPVRQPERHRLAQRLGPLLGLGDQPPHFVGRRGDQRLGEPGPFRVSSRTT